MEGHARSSRVDHYECDANDNDDSVSSLTSPLRKVFTFFPIHANYISKPFSKLGPGWPLEGRRDNTLLTAAAFSLVELCKNWWNCVEKK